MPRVNRYRKRWLPPPVNANAPIYVEDVCETWPYERYLTELGNARKASMAQFDQLGPAEQDMIVKWGAGMVREARQRGGCDTWRDIDAWLTRKYGKQL